jgi:hypothetical protein
MKPWRIAGALTLLSAAAAVAFVAAKPSSPLPVGKSESNTQAISKFSRDRAGLSRNKLTMPGRDGGPLAAAEEDYANRAYPAAYVPFTLTRSATTAWTSIKARGAAKGPNAPGAWTLAGPSTANFPNVLTFSGATYTTSGRVTAIAIDPSCNVRTCRVWAAAAGGGVWRTTNALAGS